MSAPHHAFFRLSTRNRATSVSLFKEEAKFGSLLVRQLKAVHEFPQSPWGWQTTMFSFGTPGPKRGVAKIQLPSCGTQIRTKETSKINGESQIRHGDIIHYWWIP